MIYIIKHAGLYQNKVNSSLISIFNCKMGYCQLIDRYQIHGDINRKMTIMTIIHLKVSERFLACSDWSRAIFNFQVQTMEKTKWRPSFPLSLPSECPRNF